MNNNYNTEFYLLFSEVYKFEFTKTNPYHFHILDLILFNNMITNIQELNIEINCLENESFIKLLNLLYYGNSITKLKISLFSADLTYLPQNIYMVYLDSFKNIEEGNQELKKNFDSNTYLFNDLKEIEDKILDKLYKDFEHSLAELFEIINLKNNLIELGFNVDVPYNIRNKSKYMNAIYKFILNMLFYVSKHKIEKFYLLIAY